MKTPITLRYRLWFEQDGEHVMGSGMLHLLRCVHELGSLKKAAESMGMPYRGAWGRVRKAEGVLGVPLVASSRRRQRGVTLTPAALELLEVFTLLDTQCNAFLRERLRELPLNAFAMDSGH